VLLLGRWPRLKYLKVGNFSIRPQDGGSLSTDIVAFLKAHANLENLTLSTSMPCRDEFQAYASVELPCLRTFSGRIQQLSPGNHPFLQNLTLTISSSILSITRDLDSLRFLPSLLSLKVDIEFLKSINNFTVDEDCYPLYSLFTSPPKLRHLDITTDLPMALRNLSPGIRGAKNLRTFTVTGYLSETKFTSSAILIANQSSSLQELTVQSLISWGWCNRSIVKKLRTYLIERDQMLKPTRLLVVERGKATGKFKERICFSGPLTINLSSR